MKSKKTGGNTSSVEYSPARIKRMEQAKKKQEDRWAAKSGPVTNEKSDR